MSDFVPTPDEPAPNVVEANAFTSLLARLRGRLIVSCQADPGSPFRDLRFIEAFARAAEQGGAAALRVAGLEDVWAVRAVSTLPLIGLTKRHLPGTEVYITPTPEEARALAEAGCAIVAFDATRRVRPHSVLELIQTIHACGALAMADCATIADAVEAVASGADIVGTTLSGYTADSPNLAGPDYAFIREASALDIPVFAEGRIRMPLEAAEALKVGAFAVVVGSAITRPDHVTTWFSKALEQVFSG